jgi:broad specificity phosphatase PhoE
MIGKRVSPGETVVIRSASTSRAGQTAGHIHRGLMDGIAMFEKDVKVFEPEPMAEFLNFRVATPDGLRDITGAFRNYYATLEEFERSALGDRPMWLVEVDRFWRTQQGGGDPIQHWLQIPTFHFEPPAMVVRRFWTGIHRLAEEFPGARILVTTHSGPIRAFAITALGYDPGEPYNTEHVRVKLFEGGKEAVVTYRNRAQEIQVPQIERLPTWQMDEQWMPQ